MSRSLRSLALIAAGLLAASSGSPVRATNGYFADAYGVKAEGVAGAGIAFGQDTLTIATNPAGLAGVADSFDAGVDLFRPNREATLVQGGQAATYNGDDTQSFVIPSLGYARHLTPNLTAGVALFGNGGLNTDYGTNPFARFGATGSAGVDLAQLFLSPALAWKLNPQNEIGVAVNLAYQRFKAKGIGIFGHFSADPAAVSDQGYDNSYGAGVRLGWIGHVNEYLAVGATWQSKTYMSRFTKYAGLFADQGAFDVPGTYGFGIAVTPDRNWTLLLDWQQIQYSQVAAVANPIDGLFQGLPLGSSNGPGFGWRDVNVARIGAIFKVREQWTLRAGFSDNRQPIPASQTFFNILAPGVVEAHLTAGLTWKASRNDEVSASYLHAFGHTVYGSGSIPPALGGGEANIHLEENSFGVNWTHLF